MTWCVCTLPESFRVVLVVLLACGTLSVTITVAFGVPLLVGHAVAGLLLDFASDLSDAYMLAIGM